MDKLILNHLVKKIKEGSYYKLPFAVPEGVQSITIFYQYPKKNDIKNAKENVIDIGLENGEGQFLGWSGSSREQITVGEFDGTPGYLMEPVKAGTWNILIGAYHVQEEGVPVVYEITFEKKHPSWLFGDLHIHSDASDGQHDIPTLAKKAKEKKLDYIAVTNHNNYSENMFLPKVQGITLIPGVEWTHYRGHMNFWGIKKPFNGSFIANNLEEMKKIVGEARANGALISVNHPKCPMCPYLWEDEDDFQAIEVWNGPMRKTNVDGIAWWTELLKKGRKIIAVGGSDFHRDGEPVELGNPVTAIYAESQSAEAIMDSIAKGHVYITDDIHGVRLDMKCNEYVFGDTVEDQEKIHTLQISAEKMPCTSVLQVVGTSGVIKEIKSERGKVEDTIEIKDTSFVYLLAIQKTLPINRQILAVSNPIYFSNK